MIETSVLVQKLNFTWHAHLFNMCVLSTYYVPRPPAVNKPEKSLVLPQFTFWGLFIMKAKHGGLDPQNWLLLVLSVPLSSGTRDDFD